MLREVGVHVQLGHSGSVRDPVLFCHVGPYAGVFPWGCLLLQDFAVWWLLGVRGAAWMHTSTIHNQLQEKHHEQPGA